jgi:hypothetical protein
VTVAPAATTRVDSAIDRLSALGNSERARLYVRLAFHFSSIQSIARWNFRNGHAVAILKAVDLT